MMTDELFEECLPGCRGAAGQLHHKGHHPACRHKGGADSRRVLAALGDKALHQLGASTADVTTATTYTRAALALYGSIIFWWDRPTAPLPQIPRGLGRLARPLARPLSRLLPVPTPAGTGPGRCWMQDSPSSATVGRSKAGWMVRRTAGATARKGHTHHCGTLSTWRSAR